MEQNKPRIFWLGMHKILRPTELVHLREMGYEVFSPNYLSPVYDQSADLTRQDDQFSTLPPRVLAKLLAYDFFYREIDPDIAALLNEHFGLMIVTINPDWLLAMLDAFAGPVVYRIYGQHYSLSHHFMVAGAWERLADRPNLHIIPFADESIEQEQEWFRELCTEAVPYQIPDDVFDFAPPDEPRKRPEVSTSIPNIQNPYYGRVYHEFVGAFPDRFFRILGPQRVLPADSRILGEMERQRYLERLTTSAGYLYTYQDNVCYLPPIEMMQLGGPVVFLPGSLLAQFSDPASPGAARNAGRARVICRRLVRGDRVLADEIVAAQEPVRRRYDRAIVRPIFERVVGKVLANPQRRASNGASHADIVARVAEHGEIVAIPLHVDGFFHYIDGHPSALEGIPRVVDAVVDTIVSSTKAHVVLSCTHGSRAVMFDFFKQHIRAGRVSVFVFDKRSTESAALLAFEKLRFVDYLAKAGIAVKAVLVPHYYLFPEMVLSDAPLTLYLPDYFPYLMPDTVFDASVEKDRLNKRIGHRLATKAGHILTNSAYTKSYLPRTGLVAPRESDKIVVAPLPFLGAKRAQPVTAAEQARLRGSLRGRPFLFYPTANRPNKKLAFFMRLLALLRLDRPDLCAVLTCNLDSVPEVAVIARDYDLHRSLVMMPGSTESTMRWLYEHCAALCLTSVAEGNFPPQILEALNYGAPVVATRLPTIEEIAGEELGKMLLCEPLDISDFADKVSVAIDDREDVLRRQSDVLRHLRMWNSAEAFAIAMGKVLPGVTFAAE